MDLHRPEPSSTPLRETKKSYPKPTKNRKLRKIWKSVETKKNSRSKKIQSLFIFGPDKGHRIWTGVHFELAQRRRFRCQIKTENSKNSKNSHWHQTQNHQIWAYSKNFQNRLRIWEKRKNGKCRRLNQNERNRIIFVEINWNFSPDFFDFFSIFSRFFGIVIWNPPFLSHIHMNIN